MCRWRGFVFIRNQEIVVIVILVLKILTFVDTFSQFFCYLYVRWASRKPVFWSVTQECKMCFLSIPTLIPHKRKKINACSLLNTLYNVVTKQYIVVTWIKVFLLQLNYLFEGAKDVNFQFPSLHFKDWDEVFVSKESKDISLANKIF